MSASADAENGDDCGELKTLLGGRTQSYQWYPMARKYSRRELVADYMVLVTGSLFAFVASIMLLWRSIVSGDEGRKIVGLAVYCFGLLSTMNASLAFNRLVWKDGWFPILLFGDTVSINLMIAGCYTPICLQAGCISMLCTTWCLAFVGIVVQLIYYGVPPAQRYPFDGLLFALMGWVIVPFWGHISPYLSHWAKHLIVTFGLIYTIGAVINRWESLEFHKSIWHICVVVASFIYFMIVFQDFAGGPMLGDHWPDSEFPLDLALR